MENFGKIHSCFVLLLEHAILCFLCFRVFGFFFTVLKSEGINTDIVTFLIYNICSSQIRFKQNFPLMLVDCMCPGYSDIFPYWFTYQLCKSAKAALIFFTELSTSSLIIMRYLVRETVQRCKSLTDFSMFGPKAKQK